MDKMQEYQAELFKALSSPIRLAILEVLKEGEHGVNDIAAAINTEQSYISQQLSILRSNGILKYRKEGNFVYYSILDPSILILLEQAALISKKRVVDLQLVLGKLSDNDEKEKV